MNTPLTTTSRHQITSKPEMRTHDWLSGPLGSVEALPSNDMFLSLRHSRSVNTFQDEWNTQTLPAAGSHFLAQPSQCSGTPTLLPSPSPMHLIRPSIPPTQPKDYQLTYVHYAEQVLTFRAATEDFIELIPLLSKKPAAQIATTTTA